jgi:RES domain-containing protein
MLKGTALDAALKRIPTIRLQSTLARKVPLLDLIGHKPIQFLFTSGKPNRFNLAKTNCLYSSEDERTATEEWERLLGGLSVKHCATFFANIQIGTVLDLDDSKIRAALQLSDGELFADWATAGSPVDTQLLGEAVATSTTSIAAIRFPSDAARVAGFHGVNIVIFRDKIVVPDSVIVLNDNGSVLEQIP